MERRSAWRKLRRLAFWMIGLWLFSLCGLIFFLLYPVPLVSRALALSTCAVIWAISTCVVWVIRKRWLFCQKQQAFEGEESIK